MDRTFDYRNAFSRNIGWVTETEQEILKSRRIAIVSLGGVGGSHLLTLTRMGIGRFNISDLDNFELENFNRQAEKNTGAVSGCRLQHTQLARRPGTKSGGWQNFCSSMLKSG